MEIMSLTLFVVSKSHRLLVGQARRRTYHRISPVLQMWSLTLWSYGDEDGDDEVSLICGITVSGCYVLHIVGFYMWSLEKTQEDCVSLKKEKEKRKPNTPPPLSSHRNPPPTQLPNLTPSNVYTNVGYQLVTESKCNICTTYVTLLKHFWPEMCSYQPRPTLMIALARNMIKAHKNLCFIVKLVQKYNRILLKKFKVYNKPK